MDDDPLERAWAELEESWDDEARHARMLALGDATDRLPELARRYRLAKETSEARREVAERWLSEITARALGRMSSSRREAPPRRSRLEWIALGVSVALGTAALYQLLRTM